MSQVSFQVLNVSLCRLILNYQFILNIPTYSGSYVFKIRMQPVRSPILLPLSHQNALVACRDPLALWSAARSLLWEMHLPKLFEQNLWNFGLRAGATPSCVDPTPLQSLRLSQGCRTILKGPSLGCCKAGMLESSGKAKRKILMSSNIVYFKFYFAFRWSELHCDSSARYLSHLRREPEKRRRLHLCIHLERKMELLKPISSENGIKSAFEKVVLTHLRKFTLCKNK